jgi:putative redox protein
MIGGHLVAEVTLVNERLKFECVAESRPTVVVDYTPPAGDGEGITSLELLLMSLATCFGSSLKVILSGPMKRHVQSLHIKAEGDRAQTHPTLFQSISLHVDLVADGLDPETMKSVQSRAEQICPVYAMLKDSVPIAVDYRLSAGS